MRLLTAMDRMESVLVDVDAPKRQLRGVQEWRVAIAHAVLGASAFKRPPGMEIFDKPRLGVTGWVHPHGVRFLYRSRTHKAWRDLCGEIDSALAIQQGHAVNLQAFWLRRAKAAFAAQMPRQYNYALAQATLASRWGNAAHLAMIHGHVLVRQEDRIMRPVGVAIRRAGGIREVARDKHYHQRAGRH